MLNTINFIWLGGFLPDKCQVVIEQWEAFSKECQALASTQQNGGNFVIRFWVDKIGSTPEVIRRLEDALGKKVQILDITEHNLSSETIRYEIDRAVPNYGAASDLIRYRLLHQKRDDEKVLYIDTDVECPEPTSESALARFEKFIAVWKQNNFLLPDYRKREGGGGHFNDCLLNASGHSNEFARYLQEQSEQNYRIDRITLQANGIPREKALYATWCTAYLYKTTNYIMSATAERTGPDLIEKWIAHVMKTQEEGHRNYGFTHINPADIRKPFVATSLSWAGRPPRFDQTVEEALTRLRNTLLFEMHNFKVLRLDDYIQDFMDSTSQINLQAGETIETRKQQAFDTIERVLAENTAGLPAVRMIQCTFKYSDKYPKMTKIYDQFHLKEKAGFTYNPHPTPEDQLNIDTTQILINASQPFSEMHLQGRIEAARTRIAILEKDLAELPKEKASREEMRVLQQQLKEQSVLLRTSTRAYDLAFAVARKAFLLGAADYFLKNLTRLTSTPLTPGPRTAEMKWLQNNIHLLRQILKKEFPEEKHMRETLKQAEQSMEAMLNPKKTKEKTSLFSSLFSRPPRVGQLGNPAEPELSPELGDHAHSATMVAAAAADFGEEPDFEENPAPGFRRD